MTVAKQSQIGNNITITQSDDDVLVCFNGEIHELTSADNGYMTNYSHGKAKGYKWVGDSFSLHWDNIMNTFALYTVIEIDDESDRLIRGKRIYSKLTITREFC